MITTPVIVKNAGTANILAATLFSVLRWRSPQTSQPKESENLGSSDSMPQAQFQQELYRACCDYTKGVVTTFPECGNAKGGIDFFICSKEWGIELLRDGSRLAAHNARFTEGEYGKWIEGGKMDDYIMIELHSKVPTKPGTRIIATWKTIIYNICRCQMCDIAVSTDSSLYTALQL